MQTFVYQIFQIFIHFSFLFLLSFFYLEANQKLFSLKGIRFIESERLEKFFLKERQLIEFTKK